MFCSFDDAPLILRLYGTGALVLPGDAEWAALYHYSRRYPVRVKSWC